MIFTTLKFLVFFCLVFGVYYIVPKKLQWLVLLVASVYFYLCASVKYVIFVLMASLITYIGTLIIDNLTTKQDVYLKEGKYEKMLAILESYFKWFAVCAMVAAGDFVMRPIEELSLLKKELDGKPCDLILL